MIKTFRGLIADGIQDTIVLHTNDGTTGYRIKKFQIITQDPGIGQCEHVVKIYKVSQTIQGRSVDGSIDFSDNTLLAVAEYAENSNGWQSGVHAIIFDSEVFNQDIYVTGIDVNASFSANYYLELEQVKLALDESTVATLKDLRNLEYPAPGG